MSDKVPISTSTTVGEYMAVGNPETDSELHVVLKPKDKTSFTKLSKDYVAESLAYKTMVGTKAASTYFL